MAHFLLFQSKFTKKNIIVPSKTPSKVQLDTGKYEAWDGTKTGTYLNYCMFLYIYIYIYLFFLYGCIKLIKSESKDVHVTKEFK